MLDRVKSFSKFLNEGTINDFKYDAVKNQLQKAINNNSLTLDDISPNKYFIVTIFYWLLIISINFIVSNGKCSFADLEFHISGCNDYGLFDMLRIPRKFQKIVWLIIYIIALIIIIVRGYYYFYKKNLFSINYRLKWLK